ncbi:MAG: futalosine hydrolase [Bacteroidales bacterium]|nr:futalosine hydrolase [Bacteroidales bacterium]
MKVLLVAATEAEAAVFRRLALPGAVRDDSFAGNGFSAGCSFSAGRDPSGRDIRGNLHLSLMVAGIGSTATAWALTRRLCTGSRPDIVINAGIAGSFRDSLRTGDVVMPVSDCFADAGVESAEGFLTLSEAGIQDPDAYPFTGDRISAFNSSGDQHAGPHPFSGERTVVPESFFKLAAADIRPVKAVTVNTVTGTRETAGRLMLKYDPDIETMEGAAFFYVCSRDGIPFIALRAVSNRVGIRDRGSWNIPLALENLVLVLENLLKNITLKE